MSKSIALTIVVSVTACVTIDGPHDVVPCQWTTPASGCERACAETPIRYDEIPDDRIEACRTGEHSKTFTWFVVDGVRGWCDLNSDPVAFTQCLEDVP